MNIEKIIEDACRETNLDRFEQASYTEGLRVLTGEIGRNQSWPRSTRLMLESLITALLVNRLKVEEYAFRRRELLNQPIERPVIVLGMPRTGTTLVSQLLGADRTRRSLLHWEAIDSIPPPTSETMRTDPRCVALREQQVKLVKGDPSFGIIHWEFADEPTECTMIHAQDFKSPVWSFTVPLPEYARWVLECDIRSAYQYEQKVLQILQSKTTGAWNLKMPSHALYVRQLLKTFPTARIVWTHRDPYLTVASACSLMRERHRGFRLAPDLGFIARETSFLVAEHVLRPMAVRDEVGEEAFYDLHYADLLRDPVRELRKLYDWLGDPFTEMTESAIRQWLQTHPQGKFGRHRYSLDEFGLSIERLRPLFDDYLGRFSIELEA